MNSTEVIAIFTVEYDGKVYRPRETFALPHAVAVEQRDLGAVRILNAIALKEAAVGRTSHPTAAPKIKRRR